MKIFIFIFLAAFVFISTKSFAYTPSEGNVTAMFGPYFYKTNFTPENTVTNSPNMAGVGLIVTGDINEKGALELAMFHMNKNFYRESAGKFINEETELMHITMGYRRYWGSVFSTSMSFYSTYSLGDPKINASDFAPGMGIDTSARDTTEYGFDFAVQAEVLTYKDFTLVLDGRYALSLTNKDHEHGDHYGVIVGARYLIQEKVPEKIDPD